MTVAISTQRKHCCPTALLSNMLCCLRQLVVFLQRGSSASSEQLLQRSQQWVDSTLPAFLAALQQHGWELDKLYLPRPEWTAEW